MTLIVPSSSIDISRSMPRSCKLKTGISGTIDEEIRKINAKLRAKGATYRAGIVPTHIGFNQDYSSAEEATLAAEEVGVTLVKNEVTAFQ